jgi:hypothetical protein
MNLQSVYINITRSNNNDDLKKFLKFHIDLGDDYLEE